jgi:hypothetical protein
MATLKKTPLLRKLEKVLTERFPPPATVKLDDVNGIIGVVTSDEFAKMDTLDRQTLLDDLFASHLSQEEQRQIQIIVAVTPDEGTGYLAGLD